MKIRLCASDSEIAYTFKKVKKGHFYSWRRTYAVEVEGKVYGIAMNIFERLWTHFVKMFGFDRIKRKFNNKQIKFLNKAPKESPPEPPKKVLTPEEFVKRETIVFDSLNHDPDQVDTELLLTIVNNINDKLSELGKGEKKPIELTKIKTGSDAYSTNKHALDFLVRKGIIHSWNLTARFGIFVVKLKKELHEGHSANYRLPEWRDLNVINIR